MSKTGFRTIWHSKYFFGNEISPYGLQNHRIDYATLAKSFDAVLANGIMNKTWDIGYWEQENGFINNSEDIERLEDEKHDIELDLNDPINNYTSEEVEALEKRLAEIEEELTELEDEEQYEPDIYQYYIISGNGARILEDYTNEIVYYNDELDLYIWGVTHYGTSWDYVLTDIVIDLETE